MIRYVNVEKAAEIKFIESVEDCVEYVLPLFDGVCNEQVYMVCLDAKMGVLGYHLLCQGAVTSVTLSPRAVLEVAMKTNAASVVLVHNHPGGLVLPSLEDIETTKHLAAMLSNISIPLVDHIIVSGGDFLSMARTGNLRTEAYLTGYVR